MKNLEELAQQVGDYLNSRQYCLTTAESCTGGGLGQIITAIAGSSAWYECGFITYSNFAKQELLGVTEKTLTTFGAVSTETALEMVKGALARSRAQVAVAVTGIAGPTGGTAEKPVGTVCFAWGYYNGNLTIANHFFTGNRAAIRHQAIETALLGILNFKQ